MTERHAAVFVERRSYRRRRVIDAIRLLPVVGALLWMVPLLWRDDDTGGVTMSDAIIYIFGVWLVLVLVTAILARLASPDGGTETGTGREAGQNSAGGLDT